MLAPSAMMSARDALIPEVPDAPSGLSATTVDDNNVDLAWTDNSSGFAQEDDFQIHYDTDSGFGSPTSKIVSADAITDRVSGLTAETTYFFRVRARNSSGNSDWSNTDSATTDAEPPPETDPPDGAPSGLSASTVDEDSISLSWTDNSTNEDEFEIQYDTDSNFGSPSTTTAAADATSKNINGLAEGTEYFARVRASNADGDSAWSNTDSAFTKLSPPTGFSGTQQGDPIPAATGFVRFTWTETSSKEQNVEIHKDGGLFDTLAANTQTYDVSNSSAAGTWKVRVVHSSIPDSDFSNTDSDPF